MDIKPGSDADFNIGMDSLATQPELPRRPRIGPHLWQGKNLESADILDKPGYLVHWIFLQYFVIAFTATAIPISEVVMIKTLFYSIIVVFSLQTPSALARTVIVDVYGMTCAFCVDSLERTFAKHASVTKVEVSLEQKKVRLETRDNLPSIETIRKMILDTGFTPVKVTEIVDE